MVRAAIVDIDGTLVDTNHHHVIAWQRAMAAAGHDAPAWRIHDAMGMGGDQLVAQVLGDDAEAADGDAIRDAEHQRYAELIDEVRPLPGAAALLRALRDLGLAVVLASSAKPEELDRYLDLLDARDVVSAWTSAGDVDRTKPAPDVVQAALDQAGERDAVMLGDTVWDVRSAARAGIPTIGVRSGGVSESELRAAGATDVYADAAELVDALDHDPPAVLAAVPS